MRWVAAPLAAVLAIVGSVACGEDGAEPGASKEATLVLDFQPNAVHTGIYTALADGGFEERGVELEVREPSSSTDAPKLLEAGRTQFAILDIHDLGLARERGLNPVGVAPIVQRPLAAVIAADRAVTRSPADPEGVALRRLGVPTREFRVDDYGAPRYPELVLATSATTVRDDPALVEGVTAALADGYRQTIEDPDGALAKLLEAVPELDPSEQHAQLDALTEADAFSPPGVLRRKPLEHWARWDLEHGLVERPIAVGRAFALAGAAP
jgi:putative hydroxymethylpyrimidine transport system substrate-binding protein